MANFLAYAAKYLPELEKLAGDVGDGKVETAGDMLRKLKKSAQGSDSEGSANIQKQKKKKKTTFKNGSYLKCYKCPTYAPVPSGFSHNVYPPPKLLQPFTQSSFPYMAAYPVPPRRPPNMRHSTLRMKKGGKQGSLITNFARTLEEFNKRRDKFLNYLAQLQRDIKSLQLPSASKENLDVKENKVTTKKKVIKAVKTIKKKPIVEISVQDASKNKNTKTATCKATTKQKIEKVKQTTIPEKSILSIK